MAKLTSTLILSRCPHCSVANPSLILQSYIETIDHSGMVRRVWGIYVCKGCGGMVTGWAMAQGEEVHQVFPSHDVIEEDIPDRPRSYLQQATESLHAPSGAVMLAASAVDAMLKLKGYIEGNLYSRIEKAAKEHVITKDMADWAHEVRLESNDQRHADEAAELPTVTDARRVIDFATALADILFVLPGKVQRGLEKE
jgi:hypothetical protein